MSYISATELQNENQVIVWERVDGKRITKRYPAPYNFYYEDENGEHVSLYGDKLKRAEFFDRAEFINVKDELTRQGYQLYESDIRPELKVLSEHYKDAEVPNLHVTFFDIEVDYNREIGFDFKQVIGEATWNDVNHATMTVYAPISSVALHHTHTNRTVLLAVPPKDWDGKLDKTLHDISEIHICKDEVDLLLRFLNEIEDSDALCGWNSEGFDVPYTCKRILKVLGKSALRRMNFDEAQRLPRIRAVKQQYSTKTVVDLIGRISMDYQELFKKYEMEGRPSYSLEAISNEVLPGLSKLEYEGTLHDLYRKDFNFFIRYNIRDTECLKGFEERLGYVDTSNKMYHLSSGVFDHVMGTIKLAEGGIVNHCHDVGLIVPDTKYVSDNPSIQGAYVLLPHIGLHKWIGSIDVTSLYPNSIISLNISPETLVGQFLEKTKATELMLEQSNKEITLVFDSISPKWANETITKPAKEWRKILKENKWAVSGYGTVFNQEKQGVIPAVLSDWFATRKKYQKLKADAEKDGDKNKALYYDKLQYIFKIKLNSCYGALTNKFFKFFDLRMGESTTGTGRMILRHQCAQTIKILDDEYVMPDRLEYDKKGKPHVGYESKWSVVYGDTDSTYFLTHADNEKDAIRIADYVGKKVNESFPEFMRETFLCNPGFDCHIKTGREVVSDAGIFVDKKRYVLHVVDKEGKKKDEMKVMGLDTKRTTLPKPIAKQLNSFIERYLKGEDWSSIAEDIVEYKDKLKNSSSILDIGLPKGVNKVEFYTNEYEAAATGLRLPGHVAASILYNECLERYDDKVSFRIMSGFKIRVFYLKAKEGRFTSIALPTDTEEIPEWFKEEYMSRIDLDAQIKRLVDKPLLNVIKAVGKRPPTRQTLLADKAFELV